METDWLSTREPFHVVRFRICVLTLAMGCDFPGSVFLGLFERQGAICRRTVRASEHNGYYVYYVP